MTFKRSIIETAQRIATAFAKSNWKQRVASAIMALRMILCILTLISGMLVLIFTFNWYVTMAILLAVSLLTIGETLDT